MKIPLLSLVIPTKNRYETLIPLIESMLEINSNELEIVVQDNSSDNSLFCSHFDLEIRDKKILYNYTNETLSAIENCDKAVKLATGKFICFIGDDDGVSKKIIACCEWMNRDGIESVIFERAIYTWPNVEHFFKINNTMNGKLIIPKFKGTVVKIDVQKEIIKVAKSGAQRMFNSPRLYHGIIQKDCLDKMYKDLLTYFPGSVPDMSNLVGLTSYVDSHYFVDLPLIITGQSSKSMSGKNSNRKHQGEIISEISLPSNTSGKWNKKIPFYWSGPTIWAQAALEAANTTNQKQFINNFNYPIVYAYCFAFSSSNYYPRIIKIIFSQYTLFKSMFITIKVFISFIKISVLRMQIIISKILFPINSSTHQDIKSVINEIDTNILQPEILFKDLITLEKIKS